MAILTLANRLQRLTNPQLFLPIFLQSLPHSSSSSPSRTIFTLSQTFHQTCFVPSQVPQHTPLFSTLQSFPTQFLHDPLDFIPHPIQTHDPDDSVLRKFIESVKHVADFPSETEALAFVDELDIEPNKNLVYSAIWALRDQWRLAFLVFKWGEKWGCSGEEACDLMIWVLGNHKKFNFAWSLIRELHQSSVDTRRAMLIMIDRYAAANDPGKAIRTFHIMEKFRLTPDKEVFHTLLNVLCKHGNIEDAEEFMLVNKKFFPLQTEGFNIILNGWCNISVDIFEAKRVWREMSKYCVTPNATSYTYMISCFSKVGNLFDSLRLYDEMKKRGWVVSIEVYNSLIYVLTHENCLEKARKILDKMKEEGFRPNSVTYNSLICPLCEAKKLEEARTILATMIEENVSPTIETYHAFLEGAGFEGTLEVLNRMQKAGFGPNRDTFLLILCKFFKLEQPENALKIWEEISKYEVVPDSEHYTVLVQGLVKCGCLIKAKEFYSEMKSHGFSDDPKLKKSLKEPGQGNGDKRRQLVKQVKRDTRVNDGKKRRYRSRKKKTSVQESI